MIANLLRYFLLPLCLVAILTSCSSKKTIVNGLDEKEANEIWVYLSSKGIDVSKVQSTEGAGAGGKKVVLWDIQVPSDKASEALALLNQVGLPKRQAQRLLGLFQDVGLVPSEMTEKIRYQAGLGEQIASVIRKMDGVIDADVQLSFPEEDPLNLGKGPKEPITASVYVKHTGVLDDPNSQLIPKIKRLVSSSVTGLDYDNVNVTGDRVRSTDFNSDTIRFEKDKSYVSIWTLIIAKESLTRFRIIFFTLILLLLLFVTALVLVLWKTYPFIQSSGGIRAFLASLIHRKGAKPSVEEAPKTEEAKKDEKKEDDEEGVT